MLEYKVVEGEGLDQEKARKELWGLVNESIRAGWRPQGGVCLVAIPAVQTATGKLFGFIYIYSQAMVQGDPDA